MATPPRIDPAEVDAAVSRIAGRHRKIDDEPFARVDLDKPADVLDYLVKHHTRVARTARWVAQADVCDGLVLHVWNWWEDRRREYRLLTVGVGLGLPLSQLGSPLGIGSRVRGPLDRRGERRGNKRQGTQDRIDRLAALLEFDRPDAGLTREARRAEREAAALADPQADWLARHAGAVAAVAGQLLEHEGLADDAAAEDLAEVRRHCRERDWTPGALVWMGLAAAAMRASQPVIELGARHPVHRAFKAVDDLRVAFTGLTDPPTAAVT